jgi:pimeloyl-ACP methyl ester carboxylesterase
LIQGDKDTTIPVHHARFMKEHADAVNAPVTVLIVENSGHNWREEGGSRSLSVDEIAKRTAAFMLKQIEKSR